MRTSPGVAPGFPVQPLEHLDALWIQVAGTVCNLECTHCFVSAGPGNHRHGLLERDDVRRHVADAVALGVKEFYVTGGEPFLHPRVLEILEDTLASGPCTVLTNGTLFTRRRLDRLRRIAAAARYTLEIRVSLDGPTRDAHDAIRGAGSFRRALDGLRDLERAGLLPIATFTLPPGSDPAEYSERCLELLRAEGLSRPRLKLLPWFHLGREAERGRGYAAEESLAGLTAQDVSERRLPCASCRAVTSRGVFVCPLLVDEPRARMAARLADSLGPFGLEHGACFTCFASGMSCANG